MDREIKFRGQVTNGVWVYGNYNMEFDRTRHICYWYSKLVDAETNAHEPTHCCEAVDPETVGQYTGLNDKNGKEIYDGDILSGIRAGSNSDKSHTGFIEWNTQQAGWIVRCGKYVMEILSLAMDGDGIVTRLSSFEVIGNIYQNPELLK